MQEVMYTSANGRKLIEGFEGLRLKAYQDERGIWTIGYGHTDPGNIHEGDVCTAALADEWLAHDLDMAEGGVRWAIHVPVNQNQFDAMVSLCFNIGVRAFGTSTLAKLLNAGEVQGASNQFLAWDKQRSLLGRRLKEKALFDTLENNDEDDAAL